MSMRFDLKSKRLTPTKGMSKWTPEFEEMFKREFPFTFAVSCNPNEILLIPRKTDLFGKSSDDDGSKEDAADVHED